MKNLPTRLEAEFGDAVSLSEAPANLAVPAQCTAAPRDEAGAQKLVHWCGQNDVAFVPIGGGTKLHIGSPPTRCDLLISTKHLSGIVEHDEGNATVQAGSGISIVELNEAVGQLRQFVPLDFGDSWRHDGATLGGIVATNHSGASKLRDGAPRDLVVGLHAVLSDGRLVQAGSKVVKNVSGYDLNKLFIGSFGTLGLITQVTIRLRPNDAARKSWEKSLGSWPEVEAAAQQLLGGDFEPAILRVVVQDGRYLLRARFDGSEAAVEAQLGRLPAPAANKAQKVPVPAALRLRAQLPLARAADWARAAQEFGAIQVLWDCGLGAVQATWSSLPHNTAETVASLRNNAEKNQGFVIAEIAPEQLKNADFVWGAPRSDWALMRKLKTTFDPANVCSPGRFVGGL